MATAFYNNEKFSSGNTQVIVHTYKEHTELNEILIELYRNRIARNSTKGLEVTLAGWNTPTTRERLNGLQGVRVSTRKGQAYLNGKAWGGEWVTVSEWEAQA